MNFPARSGEDALLRTLMKADPNGLWTGILKGIAACQCDADMHAKLPRNGGDHHRGWGAVTNLQGMGLVTCTPSVEHQNVWGLTDKGRRAAFQQIAHVPVSPRPPLVIRPGSGEDALLRALN
jgi:hypothetical protein